MTGASTLLSSIRSDPTWSNWTSTVSLCPILYYMNYKPFGMIGLKLRSGISLSVRKCSSLVPICITIQAQFDHKKK